MFRSICTRRRCSVSATDFLRQKACRGGRPYRLSLPHRRFRYSEESYCRMRRLRSSVRRQRRTPACRLRLFPNCCRQTARTTVKNSSVQLLQPAPIRMHLSVFVRDTQLCVSTSITSHKKAGRSGHSEPRQESLHLDTSRESFVPGQPPNHWAVLVGRRLLYPVDHHHVIERLCRLDLQA